MTIVVTAAPFTDKLGMPPVHEDYRRNITENVRLNKDGMLDRTTRIEVTGTNVALGNHCHDFAEPFTGIGGGTLYTAPADNPADITSHDLPKEGWKVTIPANIVHTFVLNEGAILVSRTDRHFVSVANKREHPDQPVNTHAVQLNV